MILANKYCESCMLGSVSSKKKLYLKTFGCQMNVYDTEKVARSLYNEYELTDVIDNADLVFINTCSVRDKAEHKFFSFLGKVCKKKLHKPSMIIGIGGCVAQQDGVSILRRNPQVSFVVGTHNLSLVPSLVRNVERGLGQQIAVDFRDGWEELPTERYSGDLTDSELMLEERMGFSSQARALVAIQRGCNKLCSFCVVPGSRGTETSRHPSEILNEIALKVRTGAREVVLLGQTVTSYGRDIFPKLSFANLLEKIDQIPNLRRIRFISPHPQDIRSDLIDMYANPVSKLVPCIHLPIQSGSDRILTAMNRNYRVKRYLEIIDSLRNTRPDIAITTDIIVGFPTETEQEFEETLDLMSKVVFSSSFVFKYSRRPGTQAASIYGQAEEIDEEVKDLRLKRLQDLQDQHSHFFNRRYIGKKIEVMIEGVGKQLVSGGTRGRTVENILVEISDTEKSRLRDDDKSPYKLHLKPGDSVLVKVVSSSGYGLRACMA